MKTLVIYLGMAAIGYAMAIPMRKQKERLKWIGKILSIVVLSLVFSMGFRIGSNESVINDFSSIGLYSVVFAVVPLAATVLSLNAARTIMGFDKQGIYKYGNAARQQDRIECETLKKSPFEGEKRKKSFFANSTFHIGCAVILGAILGYILVIGIKVLEYERIYLIGGYYITYALYTMVFLVGVDMGLDGTAIQRFKTAGLRIFAFPFITGVATILTVIICGMFMPLSIREVMGIGCTFCWYSLGPNIIMDAGYVTAGAIAFLANFLRVIISLFTIPLVAEKFGFIETTGMPIAASMDVCIATIEIATNKETAIYAFVSGCVYTVAVPLLVPLIVSA